MSDKPMDINQMLQCANVKRWHIVRVARDQTIAEHHYMTWLIGTRMAVAFDLNGIEQKVVGTCCLVHDLPEVVTGDMPSTAKMLYDVGPTFWADADRRVDPVVSGILEAAKKDNPRAYAVYKLADIIEATRFLAIEGIGLDAMNKLEWLCNSLATQIKWTHGAYGDMNWANGVKFISHILREHMLIAHPKVWERYVGAELTNIKFEIRNRKGRTS